ncbi:MAG: hypothetical protein OXB88_05180, partial [Bacteriovoracales bacterium]|nr:hypothetical protein [Bacteriovoracales bacterium]
RRQRGATEACFLHVAGKRRGSRLPRLPGGEQLQHIAISIIMGMLSLPLVYAKIQQNQNLSKKLNELELPSRFIEKTIAKEKLYSIQSRYTPLSDRFKLSFGGSQQIGDTGFISQREITLGGRYYFNDKWSLGSSYSYAFNSLTDSSRNLFREEGILPKVSFVKQRAEVTARRLLFYGKFRLNMDKVFYFDHFISLGPALMRLNTGDRIGMTADTGLTFWSGRNWNTLLGIKSHVFQKTKNGGEKYLVNQMQVYLSLGFLFEGG